MVPRKRIAALDGKDTKEKGDNGKGKSKDKIGKFMESAQRRWNGMTERWEYLVEGSRSESAAEGEKVDLKVGAEGK